MQLSVSTSPADPILASLPSGPDTSCAAPAGDAAAPFASLFPNLTSTAPVGAAPATTTDAAVVTSEGQPAWIGSTLPQATAPQGLTKPTTAPAKSADLLPADGLPTDEIAPTTGTPAEPAGGKTAPGSRPSGRPVTRGPRREETVPQRPSAQVPADFVPLTLPVAQPQAPIADPLADTTLTPASEESDLAASTDSLTPSSAASAIASPVVAQTFPGITSSPTPPPTSGVTVAKDSSAPGKRISSRDAFAPRAPSAPAPMDDTAENSAPTDDTADLSEAADFSTGTQTFASSEILSRQFAPSARSLATREQFSLSTPMRAPLQSETLPVASVTTAVAAQLASPSDSTPATEETPSAAGLETAVASSEFASAQSSATPASARESSPSGRSDKSSLTRGAKIAAPVRYFSADKNDGRISPDKTFLNSAKEEVTKRESAVGTAVAKSDDVMPATFLNLPAAPAVLDHASVQPVVGASVDRSSESAPTTATTAPENVDSAHRAVEAVLTAVDHLSANGHHSVNLDFSVGGADLSVRVEMQANQVHATFRTDSPELRSALAHEWQAANGAQDGNVSARAVTPVFTTGSGSDASNLSSFSGGDGSSRNRDSGARQGNGESFDAAASRIRGTRTAPARPADAVATASRLTAQPASRRLLAHA